MAVVSSEINDPIMKLYSIYNDKGQSVKMEEKGIFFLLFNLHLFGFDFSGADIVTLVDWFTSKKVSSYLAVFFVFFFPPYSTLR